MSVERDAFEAWISQPPYEHTCERHGEESAWPGQYREYSTELAWEAWQRRANKQTGVVR